MLTAIENTGADYTWMDAQGGQPIRQTKMDPSRLARFDFGLFWHLKKLGTSPDRLRAVFALDRDEYKYVLALGA